MREMTKLYKVSVHTTVSILNCNQIEPLLQYRHSLNISPHDHAFTVLQGPKHLSLNLIPKEYRQKWKAVHPRFNKILEMDYRESPSDVKRFLKAMKVLDTESELSFRDVNPEIIEIMEELVKN
jgi:hypothetical protein